MSSIFDARRRSLEESFFARHNADLLEALRRKEGERANKRRLTEASGITDDVVLQEMLALRLEPETLAALMLVPLIQVAWADGRVRPEERLAVMNAAAQEGITEGSPAYQLLEGWLSEEPDPRLETAWKGYVGALTQNLSPKARISLRDHLMGRARQVAEAAGGFLGLGNRVSKAEERILCELEMAFL